MAPSHVTLIFNTNDSTSGSISADTTPSSTSTEVISHQYWSPWKSDHTTKVPVMLSRTYLQDWKSLPAQDHTVQWTLHYHCDRGALKKQIKNCWKKKNSLSTCPIDHCQWSTLAENCNAWHLTINHVFFFKNTNKAALKDKRLKRRNSKPWPNLQLLQLGQPVLHGLYIYIFCVVVLRIFFLLYSYDIKYFYVKQIINTQLYGSSILI